MEPEKAPLTSTIFDLKHRVSSWVGAKMSVGDSVVEVVATDAVDSGLLYLAVKMRRRGR